MKRYLLSLLLSALAILVIVSPVLGISYPNGQQQYYSVLFRGNGEAIVSFKAHFSNIDNDVVRTVTLHSPTASISDISAYQVRIPVYPRPCYPVLYELQKFPAEMLPTPTPTPFDRPSGNASDTSTSTAMPCYTYPDYGPNYNPYGNQFDKASVTVQGDTIVIDLPTPIMAGEDGNYFLTYRTNAFVRKTLLGAFAYHFETLKSESPVSDLQVGIATDENYLLKDTSGSINYNGTVGASTVLPLPSSIGIASSALDTYYNQIGQGTVYKTASHLSPGESYTVSGLYADKVWKLYGKEAGVGFSVIALLVILFILGVRFLLHRFRERPEHLAKRQSLSSHLFSEYILFSAIGIGFLASGVVVVYTLLLFVVGGLFSASIMYSDFQAVMFVLVVLSSIGVYIVCLFGPALYIAVKKNLAWGAGTFGFTVLWLGLFSLVFFLVLLFVNRTRFISYPGQPPMSVTPAEKPVSGVPYENAR